MIERRQVRGGADVYDERYAGGHYRARVVGYERARWSALRHFVLPVSLPPAARMLDYGAGSGLHIPLWRELFPDARLFACDLSGVALGQLRAAYPDVCCALVEEGGTPPFEPGSFDVVASIEVIEHVADLDAFLADVRRLIRPGGVFLWTTPCANRGSIEHVWALLSGQIDPTPDGSRRWRWEDSTHLRRLRTSEIKTALTRHGFDRIRIRMRSHLFSWTCTKLCRGPLRALREPLTMLDYTLFRRLPNGASMIGTAVAVPDARKPVHRPPDHGAPWPVTRCDRAPAANSGRAHGDG